MIEKEYLLEARSALKAICKEIRWKAGKDLQHLEKRKTMNDIPDHYSMEDYNALIGKLVKSDSNIVYLYKFGFESYYAVEGKFQNRDWIVIFSKDGVMETAFPPYNIDEYIKKRGFLTMGKIKEILK